jgi:hypothetical protein
MIGAGARNAAVEYGNAVVTADHHLAVNQAGSTRQSGYRLRDRGEAARPIDPAAGQEPYTGSSIPPRQQPEAVQLYFIQPSPLGGLGAGLGRQGSMNPLGRGRALRQNMRE